MKLCIVVHRLHVQPARLVTPIHHGTPLRTNNTSLHFFSFLNKTLQFTLVQLTRGKKRLKKKTSKNPYTEIQYIDPYTVIEQAVHRTASKTACLF